MEKAVDRISRLLAVLGGLVLLMLVVSTTLSIVGRSLNTIGHSDAFESVAWLARILQKFGPVNGDYELVEAGVAIAIFAFLPYCQVTRTHATVDIMTGFLGPRINAVLALVWEFLLSFIVILVTWRIAIATSEKLRYGETTFLLQMPVWWSYAICAVIAGIASLIGIYVVWQRLCDVLNLVRVNTP